MYASEAIMHSNIYQPVLLDTPIYHRYIYKVGILLSIIQLAEIISGNFLA